MPHTDERSLQLDHHREADPTHLGWQKEGPYFAATEAALLDELRCEVGEKLLEIGCGGGANLHHLRGLPGARFGIDFSWARAVGASSTGAHAACADATGLPFADQSFDVVLVRDLLHHVPERGAVMREAARVLKRGGRLHLIEPNGRSPLVVLQALSVRVERGLLRSTMARLLEEVSEAGFVDVRSHHAQPMPLARVVLNPRFGSPSLGASPFVAGALAALDAVAGRLLPRAAWAYLCLSARRP
jgi:SAM-dependent methyltransferase